MQWPSTPISIQHKAPFIVSLLADGVVIVHHDNSLRIIQKLELPSTIAPVTTLGVVNFGVEMRQVGEIQFLTLKSGGALALVMRPLDIQLDELFAEQNFQDALIILQQINENETNFNEQKRLEIYNVAASNFFRLGLFEDAFFYFKKSSWDPVLLIRFFEGDSIPALELSNIGANKLNNKKMESYAVVAARAMSSEQAGSESKNIIVSEKKFQRSALPLNFNSLEELIQALHKKDSSQAFEIFEEETRINSYRMLLEYLELSRLASSQAPSDLIVIDTMIAKCYAVINDSRKLADFLSNVTNCNLNELQNYLKGKNYHYSLSLVLKKLGRPHEVLDIWHRIVTGHVYDSKVPEIEVIIKYLQEISEKKVILRHMNWLLTLSPIRGIKVFTERQDEIFADQNILEFLDCFSPVCRISYLEDMVLKQKYTDVYLNTQLANSYLTQISKDLPTVSQINQLYVKYAVQLNFVEYLEKSSSRLSNLRLKFYNFMIKAKTELDVVKPFVFNLPTFEKSILYLIVPGY